MLTISSTAPKAKAQKMSLGDFLGDQSKSCPVTDSSCITMIERSDTLSYTADKAVALQRPSPIWSHLKKQMYKSREEMLTCSQHSAHGLMRWRMPPSTVSIIPESLQSVH
jgi:hypothetical protein